MKLIKNDSLLEYAQISDYRLISWDFLIMTRSFMITPNRGISLILEDMRDALNFYLSQHLWS